MTTFQSRPQFSSESAVNHSTTASVVTALSKCPIKYTDEDSYKNIAISIIIASSILYLKRELKAEKPFRYFFNRSNTLSSALEELASGFEEEAFYYEWNWDLSDGVINALETISPDEVDLVLKKVNYFSKYSTEQQDAFTAESHSCSKQSLGLLRATLSNIF